MKATSVGLKVEARVRTDEKVKKLFVPGEFGAVLDWEVRDKNGKVVSQGAKKSESFVRQFLDLLLVKFWNIPEVNYMRILDTSNNLQEICNSAVVFGSDGPINDATYGIIVGTGITGPTITDYKIETLIAHGIAAGQLQYGAVTFGAPSSDATTSQFTITRNFANGSPGAVTVQEIALYVRATIPVILPTTVAVTYGFRYFMTIRDVTGGIIVLNGQTLTANYRPQALV